MTFSPNVGNLIIAAFSRIQVRRTEITASHMADARIEGNLLQVEWGNSGPNLWTVDTQEFNLLQGQVVYNLPADTIDILEMYLGMGGGGSDASSDAGLDSTSGGNDRIMVGLGRDEYLSIPNKSQQAMPTSFWFQKGVAPQISVYPAPDGPYTLMYWRERQIQPADFANAGSPDVPYLWLDAFTAGLSHRLARIYNQDLESARKADADVAWAKAAEQDIERVPLYISPNVSAYYR